jgi:hypothetical protein
VVVDRLQVTPDMKFRLSQSVQKVYRWDLMFVGLRESISGRALDPSTKNNNKQEAAENPLRRAVGPILH